MTAIPMFKAKFCSALSRICSLPTIRRRQKAVPISAYTGTDGAVDVCLVALKLSVKQMSYIKRTSCLMYVRDVQPSTIRDTDKTGYTSPTKHAMPRTPSRKYKPRYVSPRLG